MKFFRTITLALVIPLWIGACLSFSGCRTRPLDPTGVYAGDTALYRADVAITQAYGTFHDFVTWEFQNRAALAKYPAIARLADQVREHAEEWIHKAMDARQEYALVRSEANTAALQKATADLRKPLDDVAALYVPQPAK